MLITHFYASRRNTLQPEIDSRIRTTLEHVAQTTHTDDLVVSVYFSPHTLPTRGSAYVQRWLQKADFHAKRGIWAFAGTWDPPQNLPKRFKLIRLLFDLRLNTYPKSERDRYGWKFQFETFFDHLALIFAHELHHYRRYHLDMHSGEGEQSANRWALKHVQSLGYGVTGKKHTTLRAKARRKRKRALPVPQDRFKRFQSLKAGDRLIISRDPRSRYNQQSVTVIRPIRSDSKRIVIQTGDGETWRWPMQWLDFNAS